MGLGIELMVYCVKDEDLYRSEIGLDVPVEECELRLFTFYNVDYILADRSYPQYCLLGSGGGEFLVNQKYEVVKKLIDDVSIFKFN